MCQISAKFLFDLNANFFPILGYARFLPDVGHSASHVFFCHSTFQNARFLEFGSENANMATLGRIHIRRTLTSMNKLI